MPLERCPDNDGQLLIKKSPKDVQRHWCFQCHVFTPNEQIVIHDDEKTILARTVAKCPISMHLGPKTARTMWSVEGMVDEFASRSQCGHHLWPSHDSPLASRGPHKLLVDSWICCRFQWHWQRRILVQRKHASKYRPQPNLSKKLHLEQPECATNHGQYRKIKCVSVSLIHVFFTLCFQKVI